jgi:hypothetical protein
MFLDKKSNKTEILERFCISFTVTDEFCYFYFYYKKKLPKNVSIQIYMIY